MAHKGLFLIQKEAIIILKPSRVTVAGQMSGTAGQIFFVNSKNFYSFHRLNHKRYDNETNGIWSRFYSSFIVIFFKILKYSEVFLIYG